MSEDQEFIREIIDEFLNDANSLLEILDERIESLADEAARDDYAGALNALRMQSGFLDFDSFSEVALGMERFINALRSGEVQLSDDVVALLCEGRVELDKAVAQLRNYDTSALDLGDLTARLQQALTGEVVLKAGGDAEAAERSPEMQVAAIEVEGEYGDLDATDEVVAAAAEEPAADTEAAPAVAEASEEAPEVDIGELEEIEVAEGSIAEDAMEFVPDFITEATEILDKLDEDLVHLEEASDDLELLNEIFRAAHTLKGTASFLGFAQMADLTHKMENVLDLLRKGEMQLNQGVMDCILRGVDHIKELLEDIRDNNIQRHDLDATRHDLMVIAATLGAHTGGGDSAAVVADNGEKEDVQIAQAVVEDEKASEGKKAVEDKKASAGRGHTDPVIRVDVERIDEIMRLAEELVLGRNRLLQLNVQLTEQYSENELVARIDEATGQVGLLTGDLQESVMKMRMVPVSRVFSRFPRMVRDLARSLDKQIELVIEDHDTEMDKSVADEIGDPLIHLIRNAVDHGVEDPETRRAGGKEAKGTVFLTASHEGNHIVIRIRDDGAGMNPDKLKNKAIERGVLSAEEAEQMTDQDAYNLIFAPGFSMAAVVSDVSGRGVGMDVVKTNITRLNGTLQLDSTLGKGTEVTIRLPLTLAIISGLQISVGEEVFLIPLTSVIEATRITTEDIEVMRGRKVIKLRGKVLPLIDLRQMLEISGEIEDDEARYVVVVGLAERRAGVLVDHLLGQTEVVIKALGELVGPATGMAGATILGDGRVRLILDVGQLMDLLERKNKNGERVEAVEALEVA